MNKGFNLFNKTYRAVEKINNAIISISAISILLLNCIVFYDVIMRYLFNAPTLWGPEISIYLLLLMTFISAAYTLQIDGHVSCNILTERVSPKVRRIFFLISSPFGLMFCIILGWEIWRLFFMAYKEKWISSDALGTPLKYPYFVMPVGMLLLIVTYFLKIIWVLLNPPEQLESQSHGG